jgi:hypothetical protein
MFAPRVAKPDSRQLEGAARPPSPLLPRTHAKGGGDVGVATTILEAQPRFGTQASLRLGAIDDPREHEADRIAERAMHMPQVEGLMPAAASTVSGARPGQPLDMATRADMEARLGWDFGAVRVHTGEAAERAALNLGAAAYTAGRDIVFGPGRYAPATPEGRRLIAHELVHVIQQWRTGALIQRQAYKAADQVTELRFIQKFDPVLAAKVGLEADLRDVHDVWMLTVQGDFTTPEAVGRLVWAPNKVPVGVSIKRYLRFDFAVTDPAPASSQETVFLLWGINPNYHHLESMDRSIADLFRERGLVAESETIKTARATFRERHADLGEVVLNNIDRALDRVTRGNPGLLEAYYRRYADWPLGAGISRTSNKAGGTDEGITVGGRVSDINVGVLNLEKLDQLATDDTLSLLGSTLIHEFAHTSHADDPLKGPGEGKAYGIENFFSQRMGDKARDDATLELGPRFGDEKAFNTAEQVMRFLYQVIDTGESVLPSLAGVTRQQARAMATEFVSKRRADFSPELKAWILKEFGAAALGSFT